MSDTTSDSGFDYNNLVNNITNIGSKLLDYEVFNKNGTTAAAPVTTTVQNPNDATTSATVKKYAIMGLIAAVAVGVVVLVIKLFKK